MAVTQRHNNQIYRREDFLLTEEGFADPVDPPPPGSIHVICDITNGSLSDAYLIQTPGCDNATFLRRTHQYAAKIKTLRQLCDTRTLIHGHNNLNFTHTWLGITGTREDGFAIMDHICNIDAPSVLFTDQAESIDRAWYEVATMHDYSKKADVTFDRHPELRPLPPQDVPDVDHEGNVVPDPGRAHAHFWTNDKVHVAFRKTGEDQFEGRYYVETGCKMAEQAQTLSIELAFYGENSLLMKRRLASAMEEEFPHLAIFSEAGKDMWKGNLQKIVQHQEYDDTDPIILVPVVNHDEFAAKKLTVERIGYQAASLDEFLAVADRAQHHAQRIVQEERQKQKAELTR